jgi:hypothetical protein
LENVYIYKCFKCNRIICASSVFGNLQLVVTWVWNSARPEFPRTYSSCRRGFGALHIWNFRRSIVNGNVGCGAVLVAHLGWSRDIWDLGSSRNTWNGPTLRSGLPGCFVSYGVLDPRRSYSEIRNPRLYSVRVLPYKVLITSDVVYERDDLAGLALWAGPPDPTLDPCIFIADYFPNTN